MKFIDNFVHRFFYLNNILNKVNNKKYTYYLNFLKYIINYKKFDIISFCLNKFKFNFKTYTNSKFFNNEENFLYIINKTFEGVKDNFVDYNNIYSKTNVITNIKHIYENFLEVNCCNIKQNNIKFKLDYCKNFYKESFILFPLNLNFLSINTYIYSIYRYIYCKNLNCYKSSIISLFYYYIGLTFCLSRMYKYNNINVLESNIFIIVNKLSSFVIVDYNKDFDVIINTILPIKLINIINNSLYLSGIMCCNYRPYLIGLTKYSLIFKGIFSKLSFQETIKFFKNIILQDKIDWNIDSKSNLMLSNFVPVGSGWYRYFIN